MPALVLEIPGRYGYVALAAMGTVVMTAWQGQMVGKARKRAGVDYPQHYAEKSQVLASKDALIFNCAQRAHANTMESYTQVLFSLLFAGLRYPTLAASLGAGYITGRVFFTYGYLTGDPKKRYSKLGLLAQFCPAVLHLATLWCAVDMIRSTF